MSHSGCQDAHLGCRSTHIDGGINILSTILIACVAVLATIVFAIVRELVLNKQVRDSIIKYSIESAFGFIQKHVELAPLIQFATKGYELMCNRIPISEANVTSKLMSLRFTHQASEYELLIPFCSRSFRRNDMYMSVSDGHETDMHHHPGLPLLVTTEDMDIDEIKVVSRDGEL